MLVVGRRTLLVPAVLVGVVLLVAGCSGDGLNVTGSSDDGADANPADQAIADAGVFRLSDFPEGWRADPAQEPTQLDCAALLVFRERNVAEARSDTFTREDAYVGNSVGVFASDVEATEFMDVMRDQETIHCHRDGSRDLIEDRLRGGLGGPDVDDVTVEFGELAVGRFGDETAGLQLVATVEAEGYTVDVYEDINAVRDDRVVAVSYFQDLYSPLEEPRADLLDAVAERLADATT